MNLRTLAQACREDLCSAQCRFWTDVQNCLTRTYTFLLLKEQAETLKVGDWVTAMTRTADGIKVVRIESITTDPDLDLELPKGYSWIGEKVDVNIFTYRAAEDNALHEALLKAKRAFARQQALHALGIDPNVIMLEAQKS